MPLVTVKAKSVCRVDEKKINIQLKVKDVCWCEDPKIIQVGNKVSSHELKYHMRNQSKVIPLDLIQVENE